MAAVTLPGRGPGFHAASAVPSPRGTLVVRSFSQYFCFPGDGFKGNKLECDFHLT